MSYLYRFAVNLSDFININIFGFNRICPLVVLSGEKQWNRRSGEDKKSLIDQIMNNGLVWATQKKRRTVERRLARRFGVEAYPDKCALIRVKHNIIVCDNCGHYHELHTICGNCYKKVKLESNLIIDEIKKRFNYSEAIEQEVRIRYTNDSTDEDIESKDKRIVEMDRQRPEWFAKNLLSKTVGKKWVERNAVLREDEPKIISKD